MWGRVPEFAELEGLDFDAIARRLGMPPFDAYVHVMRRSGGQARVLLGTYSGDDGHEAPLRAVLAHPLCAFMTDTILTRQGVDNPASYGTFPRVLGRYSRDLGLFSLEEAVRRMTSFSAERVGLAGVGRVAEGLRADLVLFDAEMVADKAGSEGGGRPRRLRSRVGTPPSGIRAVLLGGQIAARDGELADGQRRSFGRAVVLRR
jgi:N-acyl-D-amino-acid deacylase